MSIASKLADYGDALSGVKVVAAMPPEMRDKRNYVIELAFVNEDGREVSSRKLNMDDKIESLVVTKQQDGSTEYAFHLIENEMALATMIMDRPDVSRIIAKLYAPSFLGGITNLPIGKTTLDKAVTDPSYTSETSEIFVINLPPVLLFNSDPF